MSLKKRSGKGSTKGNAKVEYEIAQISIFLDVSSSTVQHVTELMKRQIDLDVVLVDSKC